MTQSGVHIGSSMHRIFNHKICEFMCDPNWYCGYPYKGISIVCEWTGKIVKHKEMVPFDCPYAEFHSEYDPNEKKDLEIDKSIKGV